MKTLMGRRNLLNGALLLVVAALALLAWLEPGHQPPPPQAKLTALDTSRVTHIRIERRTGKTVELEKVADRWRMVEPVAALANGFRIETLLRIAGYQSLGHNPVEGLDLAKYGLAKPEVKLFLDQTEIDFGDNTPIDSRRYVRTGSTVQLINDTAYYYLIGAWPTYLSQRLLEEGAHIEQLQLPGMTLVQQQGSWTVTPKPADYSADSATALVDNWQMTQAIDVRALAKEPNSGPGEPIEVKLAGNDTPLKFEIIARQPDLVLARRDLGIAYHLPAERTADLLTLQAPPAPDTPPAKP